MNYEIASDMVSLLGKDYPYVIGGCGEAVYIFKDKESFARGWNTGYSAEALLTVPMEQGWQEVAAAALQSKLQIEKKPRKPRTPRPKAAVKPQQESFLTRMSRAVRKAIG